MMFDNQYRGKGWVVFAPAKDKPTRIHSSRDDAIKESERLAREFPGTRFFILQVHGYSEAWVNHEVAMFV